MNSTGETEVYEADAVVFAVGVQAMQVIKFVVNTVWFIDNIPTFPGFLFFQFCSFILFFISNCDPVTDFMQVYLML